jgi:hypothetical protein
MKIEQYSIYSIKRREDSIKFGKERREKESKRRRFNGKIGVHSTTICIIK